MRGLPERPGSPLSVQAQQLLEIRFHEVFRFLCIHPKSPFQKMPLYVTRYSRQERSTVPVRMLGEVVTTFWSNTEATGVTHLPSTLSLGIARRVVPSRSVLNVSVILSTEFS